MSGSNHNNQIPKMDAAANIGIFAAQDEGSNGEFVVHTKHTCDFCFQQPIIGRRFTSSVHSNFDLCARCVDAYSGPEIGLTEAVLVRDKKRSRDFVLKLKIDNGGDVQIRRINVSEIWGKSKSQLSFGKLMSIASSYASRNNVDDAALDAFIAKAKTTYIDGDGDKITMTSNRELGDSFLQVLKKFPLHTPFRITVTVPEDESSKGYVITAGKATGMDKRIQQRKIEPTKKALSVATVKSPIVKGKSKTTLKVTPRKFEKDFFIHARHTCDGCSKSPIIGTRFHATKIPDFDLCGACFKKYEGEDLDFKPQIQDRDRPMQQKWLKKQLTDPLKMSNNIAGMWNKANGDISDFLKKVQESGACIESATVYTCPPAEGVSASELKDSGELPTSKKTAEDDADPPKESQESANAEGVGMESPPMPKLETQIVEKAPGSGAFGGKSTEVGEEEGDNGDLPFMIPGNSTLKEVDGKHYDIVVRSPPCQGYSLMCTGAAETQIVQKVPGSPAASHDDSFLSDADGSGTIAEAIGHTLDVCVQAIEEAMADEMEGKEKAGAEVSCSGKENPQKSSESKTSVDDDDVARAAAVAAGAFSVASSLVSSLSSMEKAKESPQKSLESKTSVDEDVARAAAVAADAFSVASSLVSSMSSMLKEMDQEKKVDDVSHAVLLQSSNAASTSVPSVVTSATILKSEDGIEEKKTVEMPKVGHMSYEEDDWSVVSGNESVKSLFSVEPLSPVVLAKWDTELFKLHELGFLDERKNIDVLEHLEAAHLGVDSTEKVTVQTAVEHLLANCA